jgi:hypothetical protein
MRTHVTVRFDTPEEAAFFEWAQRATGLSPRRLGRALLLEGCRAIREQLVQAENVNAAAPGTSTQGGTEG